jgi:phosphatidylglycerol lysyltransferase
MLQKLVQRRYLMFWQLLFIVLGTTWLWAPHLNSVLSSRTSLISQYETLHQPYSWLFRIGDALSGLLLLAMANVALSRPTKRIFGWFLLVIGLGILIDPLLETTCRVSGASCLEYVSPTFVLHAIETVITSSALFILAVYDSWLRKKVVSIGFVIFQLVYGLLFISQLADQEHFNTVSQYVYQTILILWLAWFCRDALIDGNYKIPRYEVRFVKKIFAVWAFLNGIFAIILSLTDINLLGKIKGLYFAGDNAWLAQHGVIIGVVMLYLSRHLARGEMRARQIFLAIIGIETLKYSVISPDPALMVLYLSTFCALFIFRDDFDRGLVPLTWRIRLRDFYFMLGALALSALIALLLLDRDNQVSLITSRAVNNFYDYVIGGGITPSTRLSSVLLAHTITAFIVVSLATILWILFRPYKKIGGSARHYDKIERLLKSRSNSSEDFFKLWPKDKDYFWQSNDKGFVAYKQRGAIAFALADPIPSGSKKLLDEFILWTRSRRLRSCFLPVYGTSLDLYKNAGLAAIQIGSSALINIDSFLSKTSNDKWWRWKKNRAEKDGYVYKYSAPPHSAKFLSQLKKVSNSWLKVGGHTERGFALGYFDRDYLQKCQIHYLETGAGQILAFTNELPQFKKASVVTVDLLRYLPQANSAMPYLLYKAIEQTAARNLGYKTFDLGFVPFARSKGPVLTIARTLGGDRFSSRGLEQFKNKFKPDWQPNYMCYDGDVADLALIALNLEKAVQAEG